MVDHMSSNEFRVFTLSARLDFFSFFLIMLSQIVCACGYLTVTQRYLYRHTVNCGRRSREDGYSVSPSVFFLQFFFFFCFFDMGYFPAFSFYLNTCKSQRRYVTYMV